MGQFSFDFIFDTNVYKISTTEEPELIRDKEFNPNTSKDEVIEGGLTNKKSVTGSEVGAWVLGSSRLNESTNLAW